MTSLRKWGLLIGAICVVAAVAIVAIGSSSGENDPASVRSAPVRPAPVKAAPTFSGTHIRDFAQLQAAAGAIKEVPDPLGSGERVFQLTVSDEDVYPITPTENPRAQLASPANIRPGDELWWASKFLLPTSFPNYVPGWLVVLEGPYGSPYSESPPWHIEANGTDLRWSRNDTYGFDIPWQMPLVKNRWVTVMVHERFAEDGFVEMWIDGKQVIFFSGGTTNPNDVAPTGRLTMATMDFSNDEAPNSLYLTNYRKVGMFDSVTTYSGPLEIGTSRAAVEGALQ